MIINESETPKKLQAEKGESVKIAWQLKNLTHKAWNSNGLVLRNFSNDSDMKHQPVNICLKPSDSGFVETTVEIDGEPG